MQYFEKTLSIRSVIRVETGIIMEEAANLVELAHRPIQ